MFYSNLFLTTGLIALSLGITACGGSSSSSDKTPTPEVTPPSPPEPEPAEKLALTLNHNTYAAIQFDGADWQQITTNNPVEYRNTPAKATVLSICGNTILLQQRSLERWKNSTSINPGCPAPVDPAINPAAPRLVTFESPAGSVIIDVASSPSGRYNRPNDHQTTFYTNSNAVSYSAVFEAAGRYYYRHQKDVDISDNSTVSLTISDATEIPLLRDGLDNDEAPGHGYLPYYIEDGVKLLLTPFTDEDRYGLTPALTEKGYFEHHWNKEGNDQIRTIQADRYDVSYPGFVTTNDLSNSVTVSQDGKNLQLAIPQQTDDNPLPVTQLVAQASFAEHGKIRFEIDADSCEQANCSIALESPMRLPGFSDSEAPEAAKFSDLSGNTSLRWYARLVRSSDTQTDTVLVSDKSLYPRF